MALRKTAIAIPEDLIEGVDAAAGERGWSRSKFITEVLRRALQAKRDATITRKLDEMFADRELLARQRREASDLADAAVDWSDEAW